MLCWAQCSEEFQGEAHLLVVPRGDQEVGVSHGARVLHVSTVGDVSSTMVRSTTNEAALAAVLQPAVVRYVKEKKLYGFAAAS